MCQKTTSSGRGSAVAAPRWGFLYMGRCRSWPLSASSKPHIRLTWLRITLRCLIAVSVFATMSVWLRTNRSALDLQDWCDCAGAQMTVRVIASHPPKPVARPLEPTVISAAPVQEHEYELAGR
jgi:hypothetical protein